MIDEHLPTAPAGQFHDWLIPLILAREAELLLSDESEVSEGAGSSE